MSSNDRPAEPKSPNAPRRARGVSMTSIVLLAVGLLCLVAWWPYQTRIPPLPVIDLQGVSPAVQRVIETAQHAVTKEPRSGLAWGRLGMVLRAHEYFAESVQCFRVARRLDSANPRWPYLLAVDLESYDPAASIQIYQQMIANHPKMVLPQIRLAELQLQGGDLEAAERLLTPLAQHEPDNPRALYRLAQLRFRRGQSDEALALIEKAHALAPRQRAIAELTAQLRFAPRARDRKETQPTVDLSLATDNSWPDEILEDVLQLRRDAHWRAAQGTRLIESGNLAGGLQELEAAVVEAPDDWTLQTRLAGAYLAANRLDDAEHLLNDAVKRWPDTFELHHMQGTLELLRHEWNRAAEAFQRAIQRKPGSAESHSDLGFCYEQLGRRDAAKSEFEESLRLNPRLETARRQLAKLLSE